MQRNDALEVLAGAEHLRRRIRGALRSAWLPPVAFGALTLLSAALYEISATAVVAYWVIAGPVGFAVVRRHYRQREERLGLAGPKLPEAVASVALFVTAVLLSGILIRFVRHPLDVPLGWGLPALGVVLLPPLAAPIAITVGYLVLARLERSITLALVGLFLGVLIVIVGGVALTVAYHVAVIPVFARPSGSSEVLVQSYRTRVFVFSVVPTLAYGLTFVAIGLGFRRAERAERKAA